METVVGLLGSYAGRDKVMRTTQFASMLLAGRNSGRIAEKYSTVAKQIGAARVVLRLFDDLPMLVHTVSYGTGGKEQDFITRILNVLSNLAGQAYFPIEHLAWAADNRLVNIKNSGPWWTAGIVLWTSSLTIAILRSFRKLMMLSKQLAYLEKQRKLESPDNRDNDDLHFKQETRGIQFARRLELVNIVRCACDLMNAINWLPAGYLWAGKLPLSKSGLFGVIASLLGLFQVAIARK